MIIEKIIGEKEKELPIWEPFYSVKITGNEENPIREIKINYLLLVQKLKALGFARMDLNEKTSIFIHNDNNVIKEVSQMQIIDTFIDYINQYGDNFNDGEGILRDALINKLYAGVGTYFSEKVLKLMKLDHEIQFQEDEKDCSYFYYRNGYVRVTAENIKLYKYKNLEKAVWKNQILNRDFKEVSPTKFHEFSFFEFCNNIANNYTNTQTKQRNDPDRFEVFQQIMGYNLHRFYERKLKAPIFTDSRVSDEASGRTGKTLICKALGKMLNATDESRTYIELNGKDFDMHDKFKYQELSVETRLVHINDIHRNFDFSLLFNDITEGIKCQRKNETPFRVKTKIVLTTNMTVKIQGDSAKDRSIEFEFADYYSAKFSPDIEFNEWFFTDWDETKWNLFDNFMLSCVQKYLKNGLSVAKGININTRKLVTETHEYFVDFMEELGIVHGEKYDKGKLFENFMTESNKKQFPLLKPNTFTKWLKLFGEYRSEFERVEETKSNGDRFIIFHKTQEQIQKEKDEELSI